MAAERQSRQSFLGAHAGTQLGGARIAVVGLGGGGSHVVQQLAHVGVGALVLIDDDRVSESNLNRLVGATEDDAARGALKVEVAERLALGIHRATRVTGLAKRWQDVLEHLRACDAIFGCVDSLADREQLEKLARRYLIPLIDIGIDVTTVEPEPPQMAGQVFVSMPGRPCMRCAGLIDETRLGEEANRYGDAGPRPQVVWANGVLASTAVGLAVDLLTGWTRAEPTPFYFSYEANRHSIAPHRKLPFIVDKCTHFAEEEVGAPVFRSV